MTVKIAIFFLLFIFTSCALGEFNLTIVHISDFHSHWYEFDENKHDCSEEESKAGKCYGGFARLLTFVREIRKKEENVLVLSSGEFYMGDSLYPLHGWKMARSLLPKLRLDAMSLSNHDFDNRIFDLSVFLYAMEFPVLCANMIARNTSFLYSRVNKSVVLDVNGTKVGIVGYIHRHALKKSHNAVSFKFVPEIPVLQEEVSRLESEGVDKIIALGHAGYFTDIEIAKKVKGVDIVMGGDSNIMLFDPGHDADELSRVGNIHGNYPRVHHQEPETADTPSLANRTLVLHIPQHGMYVGVLRATFDDNGKIIHESGEPVILDNSIPQDAATLEYLEYSKGAIEEQKAHSRLPDEADILGVTSKQLDGNPRRCRMFECSLGNFIVDAMLHELTFHYRNKSEDRYYVERWGPIDALVWNAGTILRSIEPGYIMIRDIVKSIYLGDFIKRTYMSGQQVLDMMEHCVKHYDPSGVTAPGSFLQIAGLKVEYDLSQLPGKRVKSLMIRCRDCGDENIFYPIVAYKTYIIGMPTFMYSGRDGYYDFEAENTGEEDMGQFDVLLIVEYLKRMYEVEPKVDGRIKFYQYNMQSNSSFAPPLLYGEPVSEYNKLNGVMLDPMNEQNSKTHVNRKENNLSTIDETSGSKPYAVHENKSVLIEEKSERDNLSNSAFVSVTSSTVSNATEEKAKIYNNNLTGELLSVKNFDFKDQDHTQKTEVNTTDQINNSDNNKNILATEVKNNEFAENQSLNQEHLPEISSNALERSKTIVETNYDHFTQEKERNGNDMDHGDSKTDDFDSDMKNNESNDKNSLNKEHLPEISSSILDKSANIAKTYHDPEMEEIEEFKNGDKYIDEISKSDDHVKLSKKNIQISKPEENIAHVPGIKNETRILNGSKISEMLKVLLNSSPENFSSSLENVLNKFPDFPGSSDILEKISQIKNNKKRSLEYWMDDNGTLQKYFEFKKNISSFIDNLDKLSKNDLQVSDINSLSEEIADTFPENSVEKVFVEFMNYILTADILNDLLKNQTGIMYKMNTTASSQTDMK